MTPTFPTIRFLNVIPDALCTGNYTNAIRFLKKQQNSEQKYLWLAEAYLGRGNQKEAVRYVEKALVLNTRSIQAYCLQSRLYPKDALNILQIALSHLQTMEKENVCSLLKTYGLEDGDRGEDLEPNKEAHIFEGKYLSILLGRLEDSSKKTQESIQGEVYSTNKERLHLLGTVYNERSRMYRLQGDYQQALEVSQQVNQHDGLNMQGWLETALNYLALNQIENAVKSCEQAYQHAPKVAEVCAVRSLVYHCCADMQESKKMYEEALMINPFNALALALKARDSSETDLLQKKSREKSPRFDPTILVPFEQALDSPVSLQMGDA